MVKYILIIALLLCPSIGICGEPSRYVVVDTRTNKVVNSILWDGETALVLPDFQKVYQSNTLQQEDVVDENGNKVEPVVEAPEEI